MVWQAAPTGDRCLHVQPFTNAANNACWALGLLATALPADVVAPIIAPAAERMLGILKAGGGAVQRRLRENAAISLGRLAMVQPSALAAHLSHFLGDWCVTLALISVCPLPLHPVAPQIPFHLTVPPESRTRRPASAGGSGDAEPALGARPSIPICVCTAVVDGSAHGSHRKSMLEPGGADGAPSLQGHRSHPAGPHCGPR